MLAAGAALVGREGLSLTLEHVNMEELIVAAGVSRTSSYRKWPTKDAFAADLLLHVAKTTQLSTQTAPYVEAISRILDTVPLDLSNAQARHDLVVEGFRSLMNADFKASLESPAWRNFVAIRAAQGSLPAGELRDQIGEALQGTELRLGAYRAGVTGRISTLLGYRLRNPEAIDWATLAELISAAFTGVLIRGNSDPAGVIAERVCAPFGSSYRTGWNQAALACGSIYFGALEPNPETDWNQQLISETAALLSNPAEMFALLWPSDPTPRP